LQIARALAQGGSILLMDEPFGALDALTRQTLQDEVLRLAADTQATIVFITHDLEEALYLGDRVVALGSNPGRIERMAAIELPRPRHQLTTREDARFLSLRRDLFSFIEAQHA
jgi:NitT/TauT family transport system ATP-binding protein